MATATAAPPLPSENPVDTPLIEFVADRNQLLTEVTAAARATDSTSTQPLLSHLLLRTTGGGVPFTDRSRTSMVGSCPLE